MTQSQEQFISKEKRDELQAEFKDLRENQIPTLAKRIDDARQMGDLSENAEYHQAREDMAWAQSRIKEIEFILDNAVLLSTQSSGGSTVDIGTSLTVKVNGKKRDLMIVGAQEADPITGKISNESPLGEALLGKKKGDTVQVETPKGMVEYKIISL